MFTDTDSAISPIGICSHCGNKWRLLMVGKDHWYYWNLMYPDGEREYDIAGSEPFCVQCGNVLVIDSATVLTDNLTRLVFDIPEYSGTLN